MNPEIPKSNNPYEGVNMNEWSEQAMHIAETEIKVISQIQNPTGRTSGEHDFFDGLIVKMRNREITPAEAIMAARREADRRQDGHGAGSIQDGY